LNSGAGGGNSGLVVIYSRALKAGEYVRVGDDLGTVTEVGMLSTKILTFKREEVTIPNAVLVGTKTVNYSRQTAGAGTTVTIGYDAPWRQIHALLLLAAGQTAGVCKDPSPRVWQTALSDYYVEYELVVNLDQPEEHIPILSELHKHIQDAFNEHGVQIMSPHFRMQPPEPVLVPKSQWFADPAKATRCGMAESNLPRLLGNKSQSTQSPLFKSGSENQGATRRNDCTPSASGEGIAGVRCS